jgi:hypothetical protein
MVEMPGKMQVTLVGYYGEKPSELAQLIRYLQDILSETLKSAFRPYHLEQVHGTVVGLEGHRFGATIRNSNSADLGIHSDVDLLRLLTFLRGDDFPTIQVRIGGYRPHEKYSFDSRGMHPYLRSFSIQGEIAVAMGWPIFNSDFSNSLDELRWYFSSEFGIRHKWHKKDNDRDNDFFFVLGRLDRRQVEGVRLQGVAERIRLTLAGFDAIRATLSADTMQIVGYLDPQLPVETSCSWAVKDQTLTAARLLALYPSGPSL